ncbi:hypothetical protein BH24ACT5_BH24ACT5_07280 [soil metagenome]
MPSLSYASMSRRGDADPPANTRRRVDTSCAPASRSGSSVVQIVGTPAATFTRSAAITAPRCSGELSEPWNTNSAPHIGAE